MPMTQDQAVSHMKKIVHLLKAYENGLEALQVAREAQHRTTSIIEEGDALALELKILKSDERTARKKVEDWQKAGVEAEKTFRRKRDEVSIEVSKEIEAEKVLVKAEKDKMRITLTKAKKAFAEKMKALEDEEVKLQAKVDGVQASLDALLKRVGKVGG